MRKDQEELLAQVEKEMLDDYCSEILILLWRGSEMRFNEILKALKFKGIKITNPTLSAHLKHLRKKKWITRKHKGFQKVTYRLHDSIHVPSEDESMKWLENMLETMNAEIFEPSPENKVEIALSNILLSKLKELAFRISIEPRISNRSLSFAKSQARNEENKLIVECFKNENYRKIILEKTKELIEIFRNKRNKLASWFLDDEIRDTSMKIIVDIRPYSEGDLWILRRTLGDPKETVHLGGSESEDKLQKRHKKYLALSENPRIGCMFVITIGTEKTPAGTVGYWERAWDDMKVWEVGWSVLPEYQRKGIATSATRLLIDFMSKILSHRYVFAYPSVDNYPSNDICKKLGFTLIGNQDFEYSPGNILHCNIWRLDLLQIK